MPVSFKSERKKTLKSMYNDMCDAYVDAVKSNPNMSHKEKEDIHEDAKEWKVEFALMLNDI